MGILVHSGRTGGEGVAMAQCAFKRKDGEPCQGVAIGPLLGCWAHDPTYENDRIKTTPAKRRGGQRAGRGRPAWEPLSSPGQEDLIRLQGLFEQLADDVLSGEADKANAAVAIQALNGARSCILGAAKLRELFEVEARLAALEQSPESGSSIGTIRPLE
jgi:hypothetical protein